MKPLHSQRIKQGQRILLISEKQKEGVWEGGAEAGVGGWRFQWHVLCYFCRQGRGNMRDLDTEEDRATTVFRKNKLI